eukprot:6172272-Pleurochrysis_carterae.AAC.4
MHAYEYGAVLAQALPASRRLWSGRLSLRTARTALPSSRSAWPPCRRSPALALAVSLRISTRSSSRKVKGIHMRSRAIQDSSLFRSCPAVDLKSTQG